jgi:hypothetical protein
MWVVDAAKYAAWSTQQVLSHVQLGGGRFWRVMHTCLGGRPLHDLLPKLCGTVRVFKSTLAINQFGTNLKLLACTHSMVCAGGSGLELGLR